MVNLWRWTHETQSTKSLSVQVPLSHNMQMLDFRSGEHSRRTGGGRGSSAPPKFRPPPCCRLPGMDSSSHGSAEHLWEWCQVSDGWTGRGTMPHSTGGRWNSEDVLTETTLPLSCCLNVELQHWQQRSRCPKDFTACIPRAIGSYEGTAEGGDLLNSPSINARPQQEWPKCTSCSQCV